MAVKAQNPPNSANGITVSNEELIRLRLNARNIKLDSRQRATTASAGLQQSRFRGRGVDFQESRIYQLGDDIRTMDWRVTARTGKPHTKVYQEERERPIMVVLDCNPSMYFATRVAFKSVIAARLASIIGWIAADNGDRIGAFLFRPDAHHELSPSGGHGGVLSLIRLLVRWINIADTESGALPDTQQDQKTATIGVALQRLRRVTRPGSLIFIISDFYALDDASESHLTRLRQHNDIVACQIIDPLELAPPPAGLYGISDGQDTRLLDTREQAARDHYQQYFEQHHQRIQTMLRRRAVPLLQFTTTDDIAVVLRQGFQKRA